MLKYLIYRDRAEKAFEEAKVAYRLADEARARGRAVAHTDPESDAATRIARLYDEIGDVAKDLGETWTTYTESRAKVELVPTWDAERVPA